MFKSKKVVPRAEAQDANPPVVWIPTASATINGWRIVLNDKSVTIVGLDRPGLYGSHLYLNGGVADVRSLADALTKFADHVSEAYPMKQDRT